MNAADIVAIVTTGGTVLTALAATAALRTDRQADVHERMPTLIAPNRDETTITLRNVGKGPAFNIKIACAGPELGERDALDVSRRELGTSD